MTKRISNNQEGVPKGKVRYEFDTYIENKRYRKTIICQKSVADTFYRRWEQQIIDGLLGKHLLFEKFDEYLGYAKETKSRKAYINDRTIVQKICKHVFDEKMLLRDFRRTHVDAFIRWRRTHRIYKYDNMAAKEKVSNATINRSIAVLSTFFNWCIRKEYYHKINPCYRAKIREINLREVRLSKDQIAHILDIAFEQSKTFYYILVIALSTGMRKGEIFSLAWNEIDFNSSHIILSQFKTKSKKQRVIPIITFLKDMLLAMRNNHPAGTYVIEGMTIDMFRKQWDMLRKKIPFGRLPDGTYLRFHDLRHVYAQTLLDRGVQLEDIQALLGHQSFETTQKRYAMFARPDLLEKTEVLGQVILFRDKTG